MMVRTATRGVRVNDVLNAVLALVLAGVAYWQSEIGMTELRRQMADLRVGVTGVRGELEVLKRESRAAGNAARRIDGATRELLKAERRRGQDAVLPWLRW